MKRMIGLLLTVALVTGLAACKNTEASEPENTGSAQTESSQPQTSADSDSAAESTDGAGSAQTGKILIAYFAVAENSEVDAISSASVTEVNGE